MSEIVRTILRKNGIECVFDDGKTYSGNNQLLPSGVDAIVYPDWQGESGVRVEKDGSNPKKFKITYEPLTSHQAIITQANDAMLAARAAAESVI